MTAVPANTMGGQVKLANMSADCAATLAKALFDGKRPLKIAGITVVTPDYDRLTNHEQLILKGLFLKAKVTS